MAIGELNWIGTNGGASWNDIPGGGFNVTLTKELLAGDYYVSAEFSGENDLAQTCSVSGNSVFMN
jgi:hypothetical protein